MMKLFEIIQLIDSEMKLLFFNGIQEKMRLQYCDAVSFKFHNNTYLYLQNWKLKLYFPRIQ